MENEEIEKYSGEVYFIVPEKNGDGLADVTLLRMVNELHTDKKINIVFTKRNEKFGLVERYCLNKNIDFSRVLDNAELIEEITRIYELPSRRYVYITRSETIESLRDSVSELADFGYYSEFRIAHSS